MNNRIAVLAASVPLMLTAAGAFGGEPQFQTPTTDRAQQMQPQLSRAAHAVHDKVASVAGDRISNLWLYPTGDDHTVFAQYTVTSEKGAAPQMHLELLKLQGDRAVEERDLTRMGADSSLRHSNATGSQAANGHWGSKVGAARVLDSNTVTHNGKSSS